MCTRRITSDSESSTGSSARINMFNRVRRRHQFGRYRCSGCSQLFRSAASLNRHQAVSQMTMTGRTNDRTLESRRRRQPNQPNDRPQDPSPRCTLAPARPNPNTFGFSPGPPSMAIVGTYNSNNQPQPPPKEDARRYHPYPQKPTGPVVEETNGKRTRDLLSLFVEAGSKQGHTERTMADQIRKAKQVDGEEANSGSKNKGLDLDLKLRPSI